MFNNFLYFITALLIFSTYPVTHEKKIPSLESFGLFFLLLVLFLFFIKVNFKQLKKKAGNDSFFQMDHNFNALFNRNAIFALFIFTVDIYGLEISEYTSKIPVFKTFPTLEAFLFISLYTLYLIIIWFYAYEIYKKLYMSDLSKRAYISSNISFIIPALLPYFLLSLTSDIINILPFKFIKKIILNPYGETFYFIFFFIIIAITGPFLIQKCWGCKSLEKGFMRSRIEDICNRTKCAYADILYWNIFEGRIITAGVMGLIKKFRYILVTKSLLNLLLPEELDSVIAHEIGHIKKKHLFFYLLFFLGYIVLTFAILDPLKYIFIYIYSHYISYTIINMLLILIFVIYFRYIFGYFMRNFERQADAYVFTVFDTGIPLVSTLEKIARTSNQPIERPNWHHFSIKERMDFIEQCEEDRTVILKHENKIKKSILIFCTAIFFTGILGYNLNFGNAGKKLNYYLLENMIFKLPNKTPELSEFYAVLGNFYYEEKKFDKTCLYYGKSLNINPNNITALNNLAWLYATCEDISYIKPRESLVLAQKAAKLEEKDYILDTLAQCYFINKNYKEAVLAETCALNLSKKDRNYFENKLKKFKSYL